MHGIHPVLFHTNRASPIQSLSFIACPQFDDCNRDQDENCHEEDVKSTNINDTAEEIPEEDKMVACVNADQCTAKEPIAHGVLACRFEQTNPGLDEAIEMEIANLLRLLNINTRYLLFMMLRAINYKIAPQFTRC